MLHSPTVPEPRTIAQWSHTVSPISTDQCRLSRVKAGIAWLTWTASPAGCASWELDGAQCHMMSSSTYSVRFRILASLMSCTQMVDPSSHPSILLNSAAVVRSPMSSRRHISHKGTDTPRLPSRQWRCSSWRRPETAKSTRTHFVSNFWNGETRRVPTNSARHRNCMARHDSRTVWPIDSAHGKTKPISPTLSIALNLPTSQIAHDTALPCSLVCMCAFRIPETPVQTLDTTWHHCRRWIAPRLPGQVAEWSNRMTQPPFSTTIPTNSPASFREYSTWSCANSSTCEGRSYTLYARMPYTLYACTVHIMW